MLNDTMMQAMALTLIDSHRPVTPSQLTVFIRPNAEQAKVHKKAKGTVFSVLDESGMHLGSGFVNRMIGDVAEVRFIVDGTVYQGRYNWRFGVAVTGFAV